MTKIGKRSILLGAVVAFVLMLNIAIGGLLLGSRKASAATRAFTVGAMEIGDYIEFGNYENEALVWRIVGFEGTGTNKNALLRTDRALRGTNGNADNGADMTGTLAIKFDDVTAPTGTNSAGYNGNVAPGSYINFQTEKNGASNMDITANRKTVGTSLWSQASIRYWLNDGFFNAAFSGDDKAKIATKTHEIGLWWGDAQDDESRRSGSAQLKIANENRHNLFTQPATDTDFNYGQYVNPRGTAPHRSGAHAYASQGNRGNWDTAYKYDSVDNVFLPSIGMFDDINQLDIRNANGWRYGQVLNPTYVAGSITTNRPDGTNTRVPGAVSAWLSSPVSQNNTTGVGSNDTGAYNLGGSLGTSARCSDSFTNDVADTAGVLGIVDMPRAAANFVNGSAGGQNGTTSQIEQVAVAPMIMLKGDTQFATELTASANPNEQIKYHKYTNETHAADYKGGEVQKLKEGAYLTKYDSEDTLKTLIQEMLNEKGINVTNNDLDTATVRFNGVGAFPRGLEGVFIKGTNIGNSSIIGYPSMVDALDVATTSETFDFQLEVSAKKLTTDEIDTITANVSIEVKKVEANVKVDAASNPALLYKNTKNTVFQQNSLVYKVRGKDNSDGTPGAYINGAISYIGKTEDIQMKSDFYAGAEGGSGLQLLGNSNWVSETLAEVGENGWVDGDLSDPRLVFYGQQLKQHPLPTTENKKAGHGWLYGTAFNTLTDLNSYVGPANLDRFDENTPITPSTQDDGNGWLNNNSNRFDIVYRDDDYNFLDCKSDVTFKVRQLRPTVPSSAPTIIRPEITTPLTLDDFKTADGGDKAGTDSDSGVWKYLKDDMTYPTGDGEIQNQLNGKEKVVINKVEFTPNNTNYARIDTTTEESWNNNKNFYSTGLSYDEGFMVVEFNAEDNVIKSTNKYNDGYTMAFQVFVRLKPDAPDEFGSKDMRYAINADFSDPIKSGALPDGMSLVKGVYSGTYKKVNTAGFLFSIKPSFDPKGEGDQIKTPIEYKVVVNKADLKESDIVNKPLGGTLRTGAVYGMTVQQWKDSYNAWPSNWSLAEPNQKFTQVSASENSGDVVLTDVRLIFTLDENHTDSTQIPNLDPSKVTTQVFVDKAQADDRTNDPGIGLEGTGNAARVKVAKSYELKEAKTLKDIELPKGWYWVNENQAILTSGDGQESACYYNPDPTNYYNSRMFLAKYDIKPNTEGGGSSNLPIILGVTGGVVAVGAAAGVGVVLMKKKKATNTKAGTRGNRF